MKKDFSDAARALSTKLKCWDYEKEWRIFQKLQEANAVTRGDKTFYALLAKRKQIAHVVFGANASEEFIARMATWLQGTQAKLQKLKIDPASHDLVFDPLQPRFGNERAGV